MSKGKKRSCARPCRQQQLRGTNGKLNGCSLWTLGRQQS
ncbi:DNA-binding protein [Pseudomonas aeruginosa]|nr:phage DNA packaging protein J [Pseudomonas aeruginosa]MBW5466010.1 DNA-binding protein [Pseudomonas aeruginosa]